MNRFAPSGPSCCLEIDAEDEEDETLGEEVVEE